MKQAISYTRVSSREQQEEGFSLGAQSGVLRTYADRNDLSIVRTFEDVETAKVSGRKQFSDMVKMAEEEPLLPCTSCREDRSTLSQLPRRRDPGGS